MKVLVAALLMGLSVSGAALAQANDSSATVAASSVGSNDTQVLSAVRGQFFHDQTAMRTLVLLKDGSFVVTDRESGVTTRMNVTLQGHRAIVVLDSPWGTTTRVIDVGEAEQYMQSHPEAAAQARASLKTLLTQEGYRVLDQIVVNPLAAGPCGPEAQAMSAAASAMYTACKSGSPDACASATLTYISASNAYNVCINKTHAPGQ